METTQKGCNWPSGDPLMQRYHDEEWGTPLHDDRGLFEFLILDAFQAGLSWRTVLHKRPHFRNAFADFDAKKVAKFTEDRMEVLMQDTGIIRNRLKIKAAVTNAQRFLEVQQEFSSFDQYIWQFTGGKTFNKKPRSNTDIPTRSAESDAMSKDLQKRGFKFVGSTICYAFMQAAGMVNDHVVSCPRHKAVRNLQVIPGMH
jgi:DNA-3-methyladenine glycosylase I